MTDTVNVPREPTEAMIEAGVRSVMSFGRVSNGVCNAYRAMIVASPKSEPANPAPSSDELLEALREIEDEAGRYAAMYPHGSDGRNSFLIFADGIAQRIAKHKGPQS